MSSLRQQLRENVFLQRLSSIRITVVCLALLFILTFWGTVAQVEQGLYSAQQRFFYSLGFLVWGFLPFPGARLVLGALFVNLVCVAITRFVFRWSHTGILIIHFGLLSYFIAAYVTYQCVEESNVTLLEQEGANLSSSYHDWELSVWKNPGDKRQVLALDTKHFTSGKSYALAEWGLQVAVKVFYANSDAYSQGKDMEARVHNDAGIAVLKPHAPAKEPEKNIPGGVFEFRLPDGSRREVLLYGGEMGPNKLKARDGKVYFVQLRRKLFPLPFMLRLKDFRMEMHPNTEVARSYESLVEIRNDDLVREVLISMNNPLRFKNFTLYQASYSIDRMGREMSTLAVVKNSGRLLPYIAGLVTFAGLVVHFLVMALVRKTRRVS